MEIGTVLGVHDSESARQAFNGRHLIALEVRQAGETRAVTSHAVKPFGPLVDHLRSLFPRHLMAANRIVAVQN